MSGNIKEYSRLQYRIDKNIDGTVLYPKIWLMTRTLHKICQIFPYDNFTMNTKLNGANDCSFVLYKINNGIELAYWDRIKDLSVILIEGYGLFQIKISVTEAEVISKKITGQSLQEVELGQIYGSWEINTLDDIDLKQNYKDCSTIFYRSVPTTLTEEKREEYRNTSLIHRILSYAPHYEIGHIDSSLWNIQREFTATNTSIYDFMQTVGNEIGCVFIFDPFSRTVNAFDLEDHCINPACTDRRHIWGGVCQGCNSSDYIESGYGKDVTTYIDTTNIVEELEDTVDADGIKNCVKILGGDDAITNQIGQRLIGNSNSMWSFSEEQIEEMSKPLQDKWRGYASYISTYQQAFNNYWDEYNEKITGLLYEQSGKMPEIETNTPYNNYDSTTKCRKIYEDIVSQITYGSIGYQHTTLFTLSKNILNYAKLIVPEGFQVSFQKVNGDDDVRCDRDSDGAINKWYGKLYVCLLDAVDEKTGEDKYYYSPTSYWELPIEAGYKVLVGDNFSNSYYKWIKQQLEIQLQDSSKNRFTPKYDTDYADGVSNHVNDANYYKNYFSAYSRNRLQSFYDAYNRCTVIIETLAGQYTYNIIQQQYNYIVASGTVSNQTLFDKLMEKYRAFMGYIIDLIKIADDKIETYKNRLEILGDKIEEINRICSPEVYFGDLYKELMMFKREDIYENSNFTSDVPDEDFMPNIEELILDAKQEAAKACQSNHTVNIKLGNILSANPFANQIEYIALGNYIRTRIQGILTKMRIVELSLDFDNIEQSDILFSDVTVGYSPITDTKHKLDKAASMAASFDFVAKQSTRNDKKMSRFDELFNEGLKTANLMIKSNDKEEFVIDNYGILGRQWDMDARAYDDCQLRITHNIIGFTTDNWNTLSMAIGKIMWNNQPLYGVIAEALIGKILIGQSLEISNEDNTYIMDGDGFRIKNGSNKIVLDASVPTLYIERDNKKVLSYTYQDGLIIDGSGKFTGELNVNNNFIVDKNGNMTCKNGTFQGTIKGSKIESSEIDIGNKTFAVDKNGKAYVNVVGGNISIQTDYGLGHIIALNYVDNGANEKNLVCTTSVMKQDNVGVERKFGILGNDLTTSIFLNCEKDNPQITFQTYTPTDGSMTSFTPVDGYIKFGGQYDTNGTLSTKIRTTSDFQCNKLLCNNIKNGTVTIDIIQTNIRYTKNIVFRDEMPTVPAIVATPITDLPSRLCVSVNNVTTKGFTIYVYRDNLDQSSIQNGVDGTGKLDINWIAMY